MKTALLFCAVLAGCVSASAMNRDMDSWVGLDATAVQQNWGPPTKTSKLADGASAFSYSQGDCDVTFGLDASNKVKSATWRGSKYKCTKQVRPAPKKD